MRLLAIPLDRAGPEDVLLLGPPDWDGVLLAHAVLVPHLGDGLSVLLLGCDLGFIIQAFWVVSRPRLDSMVLEQRVIEGRLAGDGHAVYDVAIRALLISQNQFLQ